MGRFTENGSEHTQCIEMVAADAFGGGMVDEQSFLDDESKISEVTALRATLRLLDGATVDWVAKQFETDEATVAIAWSSSIDRLANHLREAGVDFSEPDAYIADHMAQVLTLLVGWLDDAQRRETMVQSLMVDSGAENAGADDSTETDKKKGTDPEGGQA